MTDIWVCANCRSVNNLRAKQCYNCRTPKDRALTPPRALFSEFSFPLSKRETHS